MDAVWIWLLVTIRLVKMEQVIFFKNLILHIGIKYNAINDICMLVTAIGWFQWKQIWSGVCLRLSIGIVYTFVICLHFCQTEMVTESENTNNTDNTDLRLIFIQRSHTFRLYLYITFEIIGSWHILMYVYGIYKSHSGLKIQRNCKFNTVNLVQILWQIKKGIKR